MTLLAKVLPPTLTAVVRGQHVRAATAVFDRLLMGQHWAARPAERDAKCVLSRIVVCGLHLIEPALLASDDITEVMGLLRGLPSIMAASMDEFLDMVEHRELMPDAEILASRHHFATQQALSRGRRQKLKALRQVFREVSQRIHDFICLPTYLPTYLPTCLPTCSPSYVSTYLTFYDIDGDNDYLDLVELAVLVSAMEDSL